MAAQRRGARGALPRRLVQRRVGGPEHSLLRDHGLVFHPPDACATKEFVALAKRIGQERRRAPGAGMVVNTCRALEGDGGGLK